MVISFMLTLLRIEFLDDTRRLTRFGNHFFFQNNFKNLRKCLCRTIILKESGRLVLEHVGVGSGSRTVIFVIDP